MLKVQFLQPLVSDSDSRWIAEMVYKIMCLPSKSDVDDAGAYLATNCNSVFAWNYRPGAQAIEICQRDANADAGKPLVLITEARRVNDWEPETRSLLEMLIAAGVTLESADNGEEKVKLHGAGDIRSAIECLTATDEGHLYVKMPDGARKALFIVYGNEPGVLVCDYSVDPLLDKVTDEHSEKWNGKEQPTKWA